MARSTKSIILITFITLLVASLLSAGCGQAAAPTQTFKLKYSGNMPVGHFMTDGMIQFADLLDKRTNGRVKLELFTSGQLYKDEDIPKVLPNGSLEFAMFNPGKAGNLGLPARTHENLFFFSGRDHTIKTYRAGMNLIDIDLKPKNAKLISFMPYGDNHGWVTRKAFTKTVADFKGLKMRAWDEIGDKIIKAIGGTATFIASTETYGALQSGALDGSLSSYGTVYTRKWHEVAPYFTLCSLNYSFFINAMNLDTWNKLPRDLQTAFLEVGRQVEDNVMGSVIGYDQDYRKKLAAEGAKFFDFPAAETAKVQAAARSLYDSWKTKSPECAAMMELAEKLR